MLKQKIFVCGVAFLAFSTNVSAQDLTFPNQFGAGGGRPWQTYVDAGALTSAALFLAIIHGRDLYGSVSHVNYNTEPDITPRDGSKTGNTDVEGRASTTPEPGALVLLVTGIAGLGMVRRRRRSSAGL